MKRTDPHSPTNLVTEDYRFEYAYDSHPEEGDRRYAMASLNRLVEDGVTFGQVHGGDTCDHCGARLRYVAVLQHLPTRTLIKVGETCLDNRFSLATQEFHRLRKAAELNRDRTKKATKRAAFLADERNAEAVEYAQAQTAPFDSEYDAPGWAEFFFSMLDQFDRNGDLSERQIDALIASKARKAERDAKRALESIQHPAAPVVEGKIVVTGEIIKLDVTDGQFTREVMTVRDDRGFKVWGTQPRALYEAKVGARVTFTATVEKSDRDETFGFFKRPTKPAILQEV